MEFLGAGFVDAFISVLAIIGIILVGGFLIFFLGDIVLSILDPNYKRFGKRRKEKVEEKAEVKVEEKEEVKQVETEQEKLEELEFTFDDADEDAFTQGEELKVIIKEEPKEEAKEEATEEVEEEVEEPATEEVEEVNEFDELKAEEELFKQNMLREIEERRQRQLEEQNNQYENLFFDDEDISVFDDETEEEFALADEAEETVEENPVEEVIETAEEEIEEEPVVEEETIEEVEEPAVEEEVVEEPAEEAPAVNEEIISAMRAEFEAELAKLRERNSELEAELNNKENNPTGSIEEYEARLETLKQRLAANDKELRKVKKEYLPLRKVNRTLENDERKLRRKEAIVAKQKVVLYGVNNISDIDEEKAKKLSEELDLLEGLKLSVQHCQEVMNANKDRYPILENTFNILTANNETLKEDIKATEEAIAKLKETDEE